MYYSIPRVEAALLVIKISKKTSSQSWRFYFALKRNETKRNTNLSTTKISTQRASSIRERTGYNAMSKNNLRRITLARGPIWEIHSLTLRISCTRSLQKNNARSAANQSTRTTVAIYWPIDLAKDLGVILDPYLFYDHDISKTVSSYFSKLFQIKRVKESFEKETLMLIITS